MEEKIPFPCDTCPRKPFCASLGMACPAFESHVEQEDLGDSRIPGRAIYLRIFDTTDEVWA